jgi:hypothetical protein
MSALISIRLVDAEGVPITDKDVRADVLKLDGGSWVHDYYLEMGHVAGGLYRAETEASVVATIQVKDGEVWVAQSETERTLFPSSDLVKHLQYPDGEAHAIDDIDGLTDALTTLESELQDQINSLGDTINSILADVSGVVPVAQNIYEGDAVITVVPQALDAIGIWKIRYLIMDATGTPGTLENITNSPGNLIWIPKPPAGSGVYDTGLENQAVVYFQLKFISAGGTESDWSTIYETVFNEPQMNLAKLIEGIGASTAMMDEITSGVAAKVITEPLTAPAE